MCYNCKCGVRLHLSVCLSCSGVAIENIDLKLHLCRYIFRMSIGQGGVYQSY